MPDWDPAAFEQAIIDDMRSHGGLVTSGPLAGDPIMVVTSTGAKSGQARRSLLTFSRDGEAYVVAGTAGGSPKTPGWVHNLQAHPIVTIEAEGRVFQARANLADEGERQGLWDHHVATIPRFGEYPNKTTRAFPMFRLTEIVPH